MTIFLLQIYNVVALLCLSRWFLKKGLIVRNNVLDFIVGEDIVEI